MASTLRPPPGGGDMVMAANSCPTFGTTLATQGQRGSVSGNGKEGAKFVPHKKVFIDAAAMKEELKKSIGKKRYDVADYYWTEGYCQYIARHHWFENITFLVIALNALWISIDADLNTSDIILQADPIFIIADNFFCLFFSCELAIRFGAFQQKRNCLKDMWFVFDSCLVLVMVLETWIISVIFAMLVSGGKQTIDLGNATLVRMLRLLRLSRVARMARLLRTMPEIIILVKGMVAAIRSVFFTLLLLVVLLYVFAIIFKQASLQTPTGEQFFSTVPRSMNKLIVHGIFFDGFGDLVESIVSEGTGTAVLLLFCFYLFVLMASLTVMNLLIGVLCEVVAAVAETEHEELTLTYLKENLLLAVQDVCKTTSTDVEHMTITKQQFLNIMKDKKAARLLKQVEVDLFALVDLVDTIFEADPSLPDSNEDSSLTFPEFVEVMLEHRSTADCTVKDITDLRKYIRQRTERVDQELGHRIDFLQAHIQAMSALVEKVAGVREGTVEMQASDRVEKAKVKRHRAGMAKLQALNRLGMLKGMQAGRKDTVKAVAAAAATTLPNAPPTHRQSLQTALAINAAAAAAAAVSPLAMVPALTEGDPPRPVALRASAATSGTCGSSETMGPPGEACAGRRSQSDEVAEQSLGSIPQPSSRQPAGGTGSRRARATKAQGTTDSLSSLQAQTGKTSTEENPAVAAPSLAIGRIGSMPSFPRTSGSVFSGAGDVGQENTDR